MDFLEDFRREVEKELREILFQEGGTPHSLSTMYRYHMGFCSKEGSEVDLPKGKYMRPLFCLLMCAALGGNPKRAIGAAAALELAHRTSLIFDDIQDRGLERNNRATVNAIWGQDQAINAGLALSCFARVALQRMRRRKVPNETILSVWDVLEQAVIGICQGQFMDISFVDGRSITVGDYLEMVYGKTAALFGASCEVGAMCAKASQQTVSLAREFGINLGTAFQIHDDYLGIWSDKTKVGKTPNDLIEKKRSLPVVLAVEMAPGYPQVDAYTVERWLKQDIISPEDAAVFKEWMENIGIPERVRKFEMDFVDKARADLDSLPVLPEWQGKLRDIIGYVIERKL